MPKLITPKLLVEPRVIIGGSLDKVDIRRHIQRQRARLKFCYERELNAHPDLQGKVVVKFVISPTGAVSKIEASGLGFKKVEDCVAGVIRSIEFPTPSGAGIVEVTYPIVFISSGK